LIEDYFEMAVLVKLASFAVFASVMSSVCAFAADTVSVDYDVSLGGSRIMKASYSAQFNDDTYETSFSAKTVGVSKVFSKIKLNLSANGRLTKNGLQPVQYAYQRKKNDKSKERNLQFNGDGSLKTEGAGYEAPILAAIKKNIMDPLSMLLKVSRSDQPCAGKHRSFDGRDVFDINLSPLSTENGRVVCKLVYKPVAGGDVEDGETDAVQYEITLAPTASAQNYVPIAITGRSKGVPFSVEATSVAVNGTALAY
jgi:Protein of unknown function (DUF3108)